MAELLLELFSEEIPARMQTRAAEDLKRLATEKLKEAGLGFTRADAYATPRRLVLIIVGLPTELPEAVEERRGPRVGAPEQAIQGFLKAAGLRDLSDCEQRETDKGMFWFAIIRLRGLSVEMTILHLLSDVVLKFPWPKSMRWLGSTFVWVRPLRNVLCLFWKDQQSKSSILSVLGGFDKTQTSSFGHRFLAPDGFEVLGIEQYKRKLRDAYVILDPAERREIINARAEQIARDAGYTVKADEALLDEVTGLVEWPVVLMGRIDDAFMGIPPEVLTTTMRANQKYFSLLDKDGRLAPRFLVVANMETADNGKAIVAGNERVLRARLADAKFFWEQDQKDTLQSRVPLLGDIVFHAKLGTMRDKELRIRELAVHVADFVPGADTNQVRRAAMLAKADLTSGMVGEFPELQGVMGRYYALHDHEPHAVADAIAEHYRPLGPNDPSPTAPVSVAVALADKIDTLVGFFAINERPTGSKDPFALRRAALGVIRLIVENRLRVPLLPILEFADKQIHPIGKPAPESGNKFGAIRAFSMVQRPGWDRQVSSNAFAVLDFLADRLKVSLREKGIRHDLISAVFALGGEDDLVRLLERVDALKKFLDSDDGANLLVAYRRASNIVRIEEKKDGRSYNGGTEAGLLRQDEEKALHQALAASGGTSGKSLQSEDFQGAMAALAQLRRPVDAFFDKVTVNCEEADLRANRLRLLSQIRATLGGVADFSKIEG
jgi:glycyl-tRNA synthetase beta chain